jgi:acyl-CoA thioesterase-2
MPDAPDPDALQSEQALLAAMMDRLPRVLRERALTERPLEMRPVNPSPNPLAPAPQPPQ